MRGTRVKYNECTQCPPLSVFVRDVASRLDHLLFRGSGCCAVWLYITSHCSLAFSLKRVERENKRMGGVLERRQELSSWFKMLPERKLCLSVTKTKPVHRELDQKRMAREVKRGDWGLVELLNRNKSQHHLELCMVSGYFRGCYISHKAKGFLPYSQIPAQALGLQNSLEDARGCIRVGPTNRLQKHGVEQLRPQ